MRPPAGLVAQLGVGIAQRHRGRALAPRRRTATRRHQRQLRRSWRPAFEPGGM